MKILKYLAAGLIGCAIGILVCCSFYKSKEVMTQIPAPTDTDSEISETIGNTSAPVSTLTSAPIIALLTPCESNDMAVCFGSGRTLAISKGSVHMYALVSTAEESRFGFAMDQTSGVIPSSKLYMIAVKHGEISQEQYKAMENAVFDNVAPVVSSLWVK